MELAHLRLTDMFADPQSSQELALNLSTLVSLSSVDKSKWLALIQEYGFPIKVRPRDGSRDIFGKLCTYLEANPIAQEQLEASATRPTSKSSPELMKALSTLLKDSQKSKLPPDLKDPQKNEPPS